MIAEPPDTYGLWSQVKARSEWPDTDEVRMAALGHEYEAMARTYDDAAGTDLRGLAGAWTDEEGRRYAGRAYNAVAASAVVADTMRLLGGNAATFAEVVARAKSDIVTAVEGGIAAYGTTAGMPPGVAAGVWAAIVDQVAGQVNTIIGDAAKALPVVPPPGEYERIQQAMFEEMVRNANSGKVDALQINNAIPSNKPIAYAHWAALVAPGADWDHKGDILDMTAGPNTFTPLPGGNGNIRYDVWSNIHYGYVGREAGFSGFELHAGADVADLAVNQSLEPSDRVAVQIGIELHEQYPPGELRPEHIHQAIERHRAELEQHGGIGPRVR